MAILEKTLEDSITISEHSLTPRKDGIIVKSLEDSIEINAYVVNTGEQIWIKYPVV